MNNEQVKSIILKEWCDGDSNPKDKFRDFLNRAAEAVCQLFEQPVSDQLEILTDEEIKEVRFQAYFTEGHPLNTSEFSIKDLVVKTAQAQLTKDLAWHNQQLAQKKVEWQKERENLESVIKGLSSNP